MFSIVQFNLKKKYIFISPYEIKIITLLNKIKQKFESVNLTMDSRVLFADSQAISRFFKTAPSFEILSVKSTKKDILTYFRVPIDIKQQYLKLIYFVDVIENSFLFDFQTTP